MFEHILVPLDGSPQAESVLPTAAWLAGRLKSRVTLIHIVEQGAPPTRHGERHLTTGADADAYLRRTAAGAFPPELRVECHVHADPTADLTRSLVEHEDELDAGLVIMCLHGHADLRTLMFGRLAQQVLALGRCPVLLMRPAAGAASCTLTRILVPVDGAEEHESSIDVARGVAAEIGARVRLLGVVRTWSALKGPQATRSRFSPGASRYVAAVAAETLRQYLERKAAAFEAKNIPTTTELRQGHPIDAIADSAAESETDLIVLGTHGKAGTRAFWEGSIAAGVVSRTRRSVLLVPATDRVLRNAG
jgi:nucleotide-binding universal stress UspA family protein